MRMMLTAVLNIPVNKELAIRDTSTISKLCDDSEGGGSSEAKGRGR
jgi:hypothetical protein